MYDFNVNAILALPIKNRQAKTLVLAFENLHEQLFYHRHKTKHLVLDNEISDDLKKALKKHNLTFELCSPNIHQWNAVEQAI